MTRPLKLALAVFVMLAVAQPVAAASIVDLGTLGATYSVARDINSDGDVVGSSSIAGGGEHAFLWRDRPMIRPGLLGLGLEYGCRDQRPRPVRWHDYGDDDWLPACLHVARRHLDGPRDIAGRQAK